jgi:hypothetical protein
MIYFEILPDNNIYETAYNVFNYHKIWETNEVKEAMKGIGIEPKHNVAMVTNSLQVINVPSGMESQFKRRSKNGMCEAKVNSEINKKFLEIVKKFNLKVYDIRDLTHKLTGVVLFSGISSVSMLCDDPQRYLVEIPDEHVQSINWMRAKQELKEITEAEYLKIRLNALEKHNENKTEE